MSRPTVLDLGLHLLDRQLLDVDGEPAGKVDDVELVVEADGVRVAALLSGRAPLLRRLGGRGLERRWAELDPADPTRARPGRIAWEDVAWLDSAVHLRGPAATVRHRTEVEHRAGDLLGCRVVGGGRLLDLRLEQGEDERPRVVGAVLGRGRPGSLLGYGRREDLGPAALRALVGAWHRGTRVVGPDALDLAGHLEQARPGRLRLAPRARADVALLPEERHRPVHGRPSP